jgi:hypothetical protein
MKMFLLGATALAALAAYPLLAQGERADRPTAAQREARIDERVTAMFAKMDTDKDGAVSKAEFEAARAKRWAAMEDRRAEMRTRAFDRLDTNKDGLISRQEFTAAPPPPPPGERIASRMPPPPPGADSMALAPPPPPPPGMDAGPGPGGPHMAMRPGGPGIWPMAIAGSIGQTPITTARSPSPKRRRPRTTWPSAAWRCAISAGVAAPMAVSARAATRRCHRAARDRLRLWRST